MVRKRRKSTLIARIILLAVMTCSVIMAVFAPRVFVLATEGWSEVSFKGNYLQGDEFSVPTRTYKQGGTEVTADSVVVYPSGAATIQKQFVLAEAGVYKINYTAMVNGKLYKTTEEIVAKYGIAVKQKKETTFEYGAHELAPNVNGLKVRLAEGDTLTFNQAVDVRNLTSLDTIFECFVTADTVGAVDFGRLFVRLTDIENPDNYLTVRYIHTKSSTGGPYTYVLVAGNGQPMTGYESSNGVLHVEDNWGALARHSFTCVYGANTSEIGQTRISLRLDSSSLEAFCVNTLIADLDNPKHFSKLWEGFESGKVLVSLWAEDYSTSSANFVITKILGVDLSRKDFDETDAPVITINSDYAKDEMPIAKVGESYPVPTATAKDLYSGECVVDTKVYYNYTSKPSLVEIVDGKFKSSQVGEYAIVYTAKDRMGNLAEEVLWVNCISGLSKPELILDEEVPQEATAGTFFTVPSYSVVGGSGNSKVEVFVNDGKNNELVTHSQYLFNSVGKHTVTFVITDYIGQETKVTYEVFVEAGELPVFVENPELPRYFISGANYSFEEVYAVDYSSGSPVNRLATVTVTDANGTKTYGPDEVYIPKVANNYDDITIEYRVGDSAITVKVPTVLAKDDYGVYASNYLDTKGVSIELTDSYAALTATESNGSWVFANALIAESAEFLITADTQANDLGGLKITLQDSKDPSITIAAYIYKDGDDSLIKLGKTEFVDEETGFTSESSSNAFRITYTNGNFAVNKSILPVTTLENGDAFNGFPSGKVYIGVEFINAKVGATYNLWEMNGHKINTTTIDRLAPKIIVTKGTGGVFEINSKTILPIALACDTLDPNTVFTVRVIAPSGAIVTSVDGVYLENADPTREYEIELTEYGQYKVNFVAKDTFSGRSTTTGYSLTVEDKVAPEILLEGQFVKSAKVGDTIVIPNYSLSDNLDDAESLVSICSCLAPNGVVIELHESNSVVATIPGVYQFRILAMDTTGNLTLLKFEVKVTE